jgi:hypothetical protein
MRRSSWITEQLLAFQEAVCSMEFVKEMCIKFAESVLHVYTICVVTWEELARGYNGFLSANEAKQISSSYGCEYEAQNLLGCTAVFLIECRPTFQRCVLPPSSGPDDLT